MKMTQGPKAAPQHVSRYRFPTLEQLAQGVAKAQVAEFDQGYQEGLDRGYQDGQQQGLEQGLERGLQQGLEQGRQQGLQQGRQESRFLCEQALAPLENVHRQLENLARSRLSEQKDLLAELVGQVARRVVRAELTLSPQQVLGLVEEALRGLAGETEQLHIYLNPDDCQRLAALGIDHCQSWPLEADAALASGDCRLETRQAVIESLVGERLKECVSSVRSALETADE
jgi:flagellar assembly protein FliH